MTSTSRKDMFKQLLGFGKKSTEKRRSSSEDEFVNF